MKTLKLTCLPFFTLLIMTFGTCSLNLNAQEEGTCAEKLKSAETFFTKGQVEQIPGLLAECLRSGFKKEEALSAYKLLIQTLLLDDKQVQADSSMLAFLKSNPEYQISPTDHSSFVYLYNSFNVKPVLLLGIRAGTNLPFLTFVEQHLTSGEPGKSSFKTDLANLFISVEAKVRLAKKLEIGVGAGFSQISFTNNVDYKFATIEYIETQQRIEVPICLTYELTTFGKFTPYARAGLGAALNLSTSANASLYMTDKNNSYNIPTRTLDVKDSRTPVDLFGQAGVGMKLKIPHGYLFAEARANLGILQQNVAGGKNVDLLENLYKWSSPRFRLNTLNMNLGYTYIFYKPSKKKAL